MADAPAILTLDEARSFLRFDAGDTSNDAQLSDFVDGITAVVEAEVGPIAARTKTVLIAAQNYVSSMTSPDWPVVSLTSGTYVDDDTAVDVSKMFTDRGLILTTDGSVLPTRAWYLTYVVGRNQVPESMKKAAGEILKTAWATQRGGEAPPFLISYRAAAWLKGDTLSLGFA